MVSAGCTVYPPIVALCIRVVWVLGGVKDKYLFREKFDNQKFGRCTIFLDQLKKQFSVSPPFFDSTELCKTEKLDRKRKFYQFLEMRPQRYASISAKTTT